MWPNNLKDTVYRPIPDKDVVGVTEATGIGGIDALEKELYVPLVGPLLLLPPPPPPLLPPDIGGAVEVTGEFFSPTFGEFSHALRADSIYLERETAFRQIL